MSTAVPGNVIPLRASGVHNAGVDGLAVERPGSLREAQVLLSFLMERRLTNRAQAVWQAAPDDGMAPALAPFLDHSIILRDPTGSAII